MTKRETLNHVLDILYEQLMFGQINLQYIEERSKELKDPGIEYQAAKSKLLQEIDGKTRQIEIAKKMLKEVEDIWKE